MKILNIYFKNINSLVGENRIHFDKAPISEAGVFAITGHNGSGKSTILDAITLALYGETFRFDHPVNHVMTKTTTSSFAIIEFLVAEHIYRSSWRMQRQNDKATGVLSPPEMYLSQLNGSELLIADSLQKVRRKIVELTGMNFHKFSQSMVLAQGNFSTFLNALDSERMDILEKISGTDIYQHSKNQVTQEYSLAQTQLQKLQQTLQAIPIMDVASQQAREMDLDDFQTQCATFKQDYDVICQQLVKVQNIKHLEEQITDLARQQCVADEQLQDKQQQLHKIDLILSVSGFTDELMALDMQMLKAIDSQKTLDNHQRDLAVLQKQATSHTLDVLLLENKITKTPQELQDEMAHLQLTRGNLESVYAQENILVADMRQQLSAKESAMDASKNWLQAHKDDEYLVHNFPQLTQLTTLKQQATQALEKQQDYLKHLENNTKTLKKITENQQALTKNNLELHIKIKTDEQSLKTLSAGYVIDELQVTHSEQRQRVEQFQALNNLALNYAKLNHKGLFGQLFNGKDVAQQNLQLQQQMTQLQLQIGKQQTLIDALKMAVFNESLLLKMQADRHHLTDNKACPLCGALDHPYATYSPAISSSNPLLAAQNKILKQLTADANNLTKQIASATKQTSKEQQKDNQLQQMSERWYGLANKLNVADSRLNITQTTEIKTLLTAEKTQLTDLSHLLTKYNQQMDSITRAKTTIKRQQDTLQQLEQQTQTLSVRMNKPDETAKLQQTRAEIQRQAQDLETKTITQLQVLGEKMPTKKGRVDKLLHQLTERRKNYEDRQTQVKILAEDRQNLQASIVKSQLKITEVTDDIAENTRLTQQAQSRCFGLSLQEKQQLITEQQALLAQQQNETTVLTKHLLDNSKGIFDDLNALKQGIECVKNKEHIAQEHLVLTQQVNEIQQNQQQNQLALENEKTQQALDKTEDELQALAKSSKTQLNIAEQEVEFLRNKLQQQHDLQTQYDAVTQQIIQQKTIVQASEAEVTLITENEGIHFRRKVQQGMVDKLLSASNQILEKISGRYYVRKAESEHGLALAIEDTKQQNVRRSPKTLSGGESFVVSLALALGLADMTCNGNTLDSLFLDEGFGRLDSESLYLVMTALEGLKTHGKTVGIISHVESVRKRIKTQIKMQKQANGMSVLKLIS